jgi:hypothetical protein
MKLRFKNQSREGLFAITSTSSASNQKSQGFFKHGVNTTDHSHGVFSFNLIEGLEGKASSSSGFITLSSLYSYVSKNLEREGNQKPQLLAIRQMENVIIAKSAAGSLEANETDQTTTQRSISEAKESLGGPSPYIMSDNWTLDDALGYRAYAHAIARFITHPKTSRPLCISIQAPWGRGKTSLMRMIQEELDTGAVREFPKETTGYQLQRKLNQHKVKLEDIIDEPEELWEEPIQKDFESLNIRGNEKEEVKPCVTIWFNAWAYESTEQIWSGLADSIIQQIAERLEVAEESTLFLLRLHIRRHGADMIARRIYDRISKYSTQRARPWQWGSLITFGASASGLEHGLEIAQ